MEAIRETVCRGRRLRMDGKPLIMGILNVTPDSFSDGGQYDTLDAALRRAEEMAAAGADVIDIGGESTRPGATPVAAAEELERVIPVVERLARAVDLPLSVDTYKAEVAQQALAAGAHIINDIWGLKKDPDMAGVIARAKAGIIIMHNRTEAVYDDLVPDVVSDLQRSLDIARKAGIGDDQIWLDPGIGFAKNVQHNLFLMNHLSAIVRLGYPVLLGTSRKSMIWKTLDTTPQQSLGGTAATVALGIAQGCRIVRVHDVAEMRQAAWMTAAIMAAQQAGDTARLD